MTIIDLQRPKKRRQYTPRDLVPLDKTSGAGRYYAKMVRDIQNDLGGKRHLTRIEIEEIEAYCGCATRLKYLTLQTMLGDVSECDVSSYSQLASTMLRIGSKLGIGRAPAAPAPAKGSLGELLVKDFEASK